MQYQSEGANLDLVSDVKFWAGIDSADTTTYPIKDITRACNFALDRTIQLILKADNRWKFDDANQTGELLAVSSDIVSGTNKYAIAVTWLRIGQVRVKDPNGNLITLEPVSREQLSDGQLASSGIPRFFYKMGNYAYLNPTPNYSFTGGLEVQYQRGASYFAYTDTTKVPGFATQFHRLISLYSALDYCQVNGLVDRANVIQGKITQMEADLTDFYSSRDNSKQPSLSFVRDDYGELSSGNVRFGNHPDRF